MMMAGGMIFIIGDDSWGAQRGRRSEMWLDWWKVCDAKTSSPPSLSPRTAQLISTYLDSSQLASSTLG